MSFKIELELREALNVCSIVSGSSIGWTAACVAVVAGVVVDALADWYDSSVVVGGFDGAVFMLSNDGALSVSERGRDSASRNFTNAWAKLSLL